jgi:alpha-tubulin suppressor-like RCC1 family protein
MLPTHWTASTRPFVLLFAITSLLAGCGEDAAGPGDPETPELAASATALSFIQVGAGAFHSCGLSTDHRAYCWGGNTFGQLGNGTTTHTVSPVAVKGGLQFRSVTVGYDHSCGLTFDDRAFCWGLNMWGQLGDGTLGEDRRRTTPVAVVGKRRFRQLDAGWSHTCAINFSNVAFCWGYNGNGQLGDGTTSGVGRPRPAAVLGGFAWKQVSGGGEHTCGVTQTDRVYCWGLNEQGQLGNGTTRQRLVPFAVSGGSGFSQVSAGGFHTCGATTAKLAWCWGSNWPGSLGDGTTTDRWTPGAVAGLRKFTSVSAGELHTCGVTAAGRAFCWGLNAAGQLGDGTLSNKLRPVEVLLLPGWRQVSAGVAHSCGVSPDNRWVCWGADGGRLGDGVP